MTFADIPKGAAVLLDANVLVYHYFADPDFGAASTELLRRTATQEIIGLMSVHLLAEAAHRLMTIEATKQHGLSFQGITRSLKRHPHYVQNLLFYGDAVEFIGHYGIHVHDVRYADLVAAASLSGRYGLLTNDALTIAVMQQHGIANLASNDGDFDRVPGITRYAPA